MAIFSNVEHLKMWVHKILPLVYDDSMSYYETLCKVVAKLNEVVTLSNEQTDYLNNWLTTTEESLERWKDDTETSLENKITTDLGAAIDRLETEFADELLDAEGMIYGTQNGQPVPIESQYWDNNANYFVTKSQNNAQLSSLHATGNTLDGTPEPSFVDKNAKYFRERAESWAVGKINGVDVPDTDDTHENNAKYYAEQAREAALTFVPDPTLTEANRPAEAKATGDAIADLKSAINVSNGILSFGNSINVPYTIAGDGAIKHADGDITTATGYVTNYQYTDYIDVSIYSKLDYARIMTTSSSTTAGVAFYDANKNFLIGTSGGTSAQSLSYTTSTKLIDSHIKFMRATVIKNPELGVFSLVGYPRYAESFETGTNGLFLGDIVLPDSGSYTMLLTGGLPAGTYTFSAYVDPASDYSYNPYVNIYKSAQSVNSANLISSIALSKGSYIYSTFTVTDAIKAVRFMSADTVAHSNTNLAVYRHVMLIPGETDKRFIPYQTFVDNVARGGTLYPTYDTTDRTGEIQATLGAFGECRLAPGDYYVKGIIMPDGTKLTGAGSATKIYLDSTLDVGTTIKMGDECTIDSISLYGGDSDIVVDGNLVGVRAENENRTNLWENGNIEITDSFKQLVLDHPLTPGIYRISAEVTSTDTDANTCYLGFSTSTTTSIEPDTIIADVQFSRNARSTKFISISETVSSVRARASDTSAHSTADSAIFANIKIEAVYERNGIDWKSLSVSRGTITNCRIMRFSGAGIYAADTGSAAYRNLIVTGCYINNCNAGFYSRRNAEYNRVGDCTITYCYYGVLCRGGNNGVSNCTITNNQINMQYDADEGSNTGHGNVVGCNINHGVIYQVVVKDTGRMKFSGCHIGGKVLLQNTWGNVISGCNIGADDANIHVIGGKANLIVGCLFNAPASESYSVDLENNFYTADNRPYSHVVNCYTREYGTEIVPHII